MQSDEYHDEYIIYRDGINFLYDKTVYWWFMQAAVPKSDLCLLVPP